MNWYVNSFLQIPRPLGMHSVVGVLIFKAWVQLIEWLVLSSWNSRFSSTWHPKFSISIASMTFIYIYIRISVYKKVRLTPIYPILQYIAMPHHHEHNQIPEASGLYASCPSGCCQSRHPSFQLPPIFQGVPSFDDPANEIPGWGMPMGHDYGFTFAGSVQLCKIYYIAYRCNINTDTYFQNPKRSYRPMLWNWKSKTNRQRDGSETHLKLK